MEIGPLSRYSILFGYVSAQYVPCVRLVGTVWTYVLVTVRTDFAGS